MWIDWTRPLGWGDLVSAFAAGAVFAWAFVGWRNAYAVAAYLFVLVGLACFFLLPRAATVEVGVALGLLGLASYGAAVGFVMAMQRRYRLDTRAQFERYLAAREREFADITEASWAVWVRHTVGGDGNQPQEPPDVDPKRE